MNDSDTVSFVRERNNGEKALATVHRGGDGLKKWLLEELGGWETIAHEYEPAHELEERWVDALFENGGGRARLPVINVDQPIPSDEDIPTLLRMAPYFESQLRLLESQLPRYSLRVPSEIERIEEILRRAKKVHELARADAENGCRIRQMELMARPCARQNSEELLDWFNSQSEGPFKTQEIARWVEVNPQAAREFHLYGSDMTYEDFVQQQRRQSDMGTASAIDQRDAKEQKYGSAAALVAASMWGSLSSIWTALSLLLRRRAA